MEFRTKVHIPRMGFTFSHQEKTILTGSCFVENIGSKLEQNKFPVDINPFGILYNPASIATSIHKLLQPERFTQTDLFLHEGVYHSFAHHSRFSTSSESEMLHKINQRLSESAEYLVKADRMIITWGTAYVYKLKINGQVVSNCHKLPEKEFNREILSVSEICEKWKKLLYAIWEQNPDLYILFTVSPIRHWRDGAHQNQISKSILLLAINELIKTFPERTAYFPSYEIMLDELRDYRFYAEDMIHPSSLAIDYIWERFGESFFTPQTHTLLKEWEKIRNALNHIPFQPESEAYKRFIMQTLLKAEQLKEKFPYFYISNEIDLLKKKLT